jgi:hypothetical protein
VAAVAGLLGGARRAHADGSATPLACSVSALQSALSAGGSYAFSGGCTITSVPATLTSSSTTSIDANGNSVQIYANESSDTTTWHRVFDVTGGSLTLTGVQVIGGRFKGPDGAPGTPGTAGTVGAAGTSGAPTGGNGTAGTDGGPGHAAPAARGAGFYVHGGATLTLDGGAVDASQLQGGTGGAGGGGGSGGSGGSSDYGAGGSAAAAGDGALGGAGGAAQGAAIFVDTGAALNLGAGVSFDGNYAYPGPGGAGGGGGIGGAGGTGTGHRGGDGHVGGIAAAGGAGGAAQGGAIYNDGTLTINQAAFTDSRADAASRAPGGNGGVGAYGGDAGRGDSGGAAGSGAPALPGGLGGNGGDARGGAIFNDGTMTVARTSFAGGRALSGGGGSGGEGGRAVLANGDGGPGGNGGTAEYASIASGTAVTGCATFSTGTVTAGGAGVGGYGGYTGGAPQGNRGASGSVGTTGATDPAVTNPNNINCGPPTLSVLDGTAMEPAGHDATMPVTVTLSAPIDTPVTVSYATADASALAGRDYDATSGTLTIPAGHDSATIPVTLHDTGFGPTKAFNMNLVSPSSNATIGRASAFETVRGRGPIRIAVAFKRNGQPLVLDEPGHAPLADTLRLADNDDGEIPQDVTASVTLTNQGDATQTDISFNGVPPFSYHNPADALQLLPVQVSGKSNPETIKDPLAGGASITVDFPVKVADNGTFDLSPQVLSSTQGSDDTEVSNGKGTLTALPTAYLWLKVHAASTAPVQAGLNQTLTGTVTNRSLTQSIDVDPLEPTDTGNVGGGALHYVGTAPLADGVQLPFVGVMSPGQSLDVTGTAATGFESGTRGTITYDPRAAVVNADGTETGLAANQVGMSAGSSPVAIPIDTRDPAVPAVTGDSLRDSIADGVFKTAGQWSYNHFAGALSLLQHPIQTGANAAAGVADFAIGTTKDVAEAANLVGALYVLKIGYESMTPAQREAFAQSIVDDYKASHLGGDAGRLRASAESVMTSFFTAVSTGDYNKVAEMIYGGLTTGYTGAADALLSDVAMQKLATGLQVGAGKIAAGIADGDGAIARAITLQDAIRDAGVSAVLGKGIAHVKPGMNLLLKKAAVLTEDFGLTQRQITELINYCKRQDLIIALRSRATKSAELIKEGLAVGKNETIRIKAVNSYDVDYLGYSRHDANTVVWAEPIPKARMEASITGLKPEERAIVRERWRTRDDEWHNEDIRSILHHSEAQGKIKWGFDGLGNDADAVREEYRHFGLKDQPSPYRGLKDRKYQQVLVGNKPGAGKHIRLVPVAQDVDVMAILKSDGTILSPEERAAAYIHLWDILDIQHGETPTWILNGEIMFKKKAKQLADVVSGGEPLAVFNPKGGVTAGFFDAALTIFDNQTRGGRIFFEGGYNNPISKWTGKLQLSARDLAKSVKGKSKGK